MNHLYIRWRAAGTCVSLVAAIGWSMGALTALTASTASAAEVSGVVMDDEVSLGGQALVLNGAGMRRVAIVKAYVVGLYLPHKESSVTAITSMPGPKRLHLVLLRNAAADSVAGGLSQGIGNNVSPGDMTQLQSRIDRLGQAMRALGQTARGSQIDMDYVPGQGTRVSVDGKQITPDIEGEDFFSALLKVWLGEHPAGENLKQDLLGRHSG